MNIVTIAMFIIMEVILIKFKIVCEVSVNGEKLGYITDREKFEQSVSNIINKKEDNKLYTTIENMPEYKLVFVNRDEEANDEEVLAKVEESSETTYKLYAVTIDGKEKTTVKNLDEAENLVAELKKEYKDKTSKEIAIVDVITTDSNKEVSTIQVAKVSIKDELDKSVLKVASTKSTTKKVTSRGTSPITKKNTTTKTSSTSKKTKSTKSTSKKTKKKISTSLNGVKLTVTPVSGLITSRFGSRESIRSSGHRGLDIATKKGTKIKAAAGGTVIFAGYSGAYGYVVKISHGSGIKTYYAHCSKLYVKTGDRVSAGDVIAAVGSTGRSTGNHLHFEVVKNGVSLNPQNYLY